MAALEKRIISLEAPLPTTFHELLESIRNILLAACRDELLAQQPKPALELLKHTPPDAGGKAEICGGGRGEAWEEPGQFERADGARFNFSITIAYPKNQAPSLLAYHFNLAFAPASPDFLRFDWDGRFSHTPRDLLRSPILCHIHPPRFPRLTLPAPILSPLEVLDLFLHGTRVSEEQQS